MKFSLDGTGFIDMSTVRFTSAMTIIGDVPEGVLRISL
jgi:hypothetical protein